MIHTYMINVGIGLPIWQQDYESYTKSSPNFLTCDLTLKFDQLLIFNLGCYVVASLSPDNSYYGIL